MLFQVLATFFSWQDFKQVLMARIPDKEIDWLKHEISVQRLAEARLEKRGASTLLARQKAEDVFLSLLFEGWVARSPGWWASKIAGLRMRKPATGGAEARQMGDPYLHLWHRANP
jgi:hypothetical protein